ncbi:MAG: TetR/AcrR family transcriptional regulator C-terminal domain-containing protein [Eubacterium sp.]|nr:TetR/AcrR family transcriptional regulator C-terminal domain-containing protein [Eubacterium sp.]
MAEQYTKNRIYECALELAAKRPLNKITVRDIISECKITRSTFYYHFHDIYDVFTSFVDSKMDELLMRADKDAAVAVFDFMELAAGYKKVWVNLYNSIGHERLSRFASDKLERLIMLSISKEYDIESIPEHDLEIICAFYEEGVFGIFVRWLIGGKFDSTEGLKATLDRIRVLYNGQIELLIKNSMENK